ncbi:MAG TPA: asparaginase domain-containing protein [Saprospiraceae bacterium]|nr:asparaginase domain-containing protein [Saprospiraceae bacterium]
MKLNLFFIQTGGTIDKDYPRLIQGKGFDIGEAAAQSIMEIIRPTFEYHIIPLIKKDSTDLNQNDRKLIQKTIRDLNGDKIIITHGTDTMIETGLFLENSNLNKTIVLTGAFKPQKFNQSDASFNIGMAVASAQTLPIGVYIVMSGLVIPIKQCQRNMENGQFFIAS